MPTQNELKEKKKEKVSKRKIYANPWHLHDNYRKEIHDTLDRNCKACKKKFLRRTRKMNKKI